MDAPIGKHLDLEVLLAETLLRNDLLSINEIMTNIPLQIQKAYAKNSARFYNVIYLCLKRQPCFLATKNCKNLRSDKKSGFFLWSLDSKYEIRDKKILLKNSNETPTEIVKIPEAAVQEEINNSSINEVDDSAKQVLLKQKDCSKP
jgi:hypothetical protein